MRRIPVLISCMLLFCMLAYGGDKVKIRIAYNAVYSNTMEAKDKNGGKKDLMYLDIGEHSSRFYSHYTEEMNNVTDSVNRGGSVSISGLLTATKGMKDGQYYNVYKNFPSYSVFTVTEEILKDNFKYEERTPAIDWHLQEEYVQVAGYSCQKATADFRGRKWTVWFTTDIPVSDGPWKLHGLPGLILKADEADGIYSFECVGIENDVKAEVALRKLRSDKYMDCTPEKLQQAHIDWYRNNETYIAKRYNVTLKPADGSPNVPKNDDTPVLIEYFGK